jgi:Response regulator containing a CheY-like receiver domain and a GGDEF domain
VNAEDGRVLVVDDDPVNRAILVGSLEAQGYGAGMAADGREALRMLRTGGFDVVLLDLVMPVMDGFEVLRTMKSDERLRSIPVIVVSALEEMESVVRCIEMGRPTTSRSRSTRCSCGRASEPRSHPRGSTTSSRPTCSR